MRARTILLAALTLLICAGLGAAEAAAQTYWVQKAEYGYGKQKRDVTARVRQLASGPNWSASTANLGVDPAPGRRKTLTIIGVAQNNSTRIFNFNEDQMVASGMFAGAPVGGGRPGGGYPPPVNPSPGYPGIPGGNNPGAGVGSLRIVQATYGAGRSRIDVTSRLQNMVRNNRLAIVVNNENMGSDPALGQGKNLKVVYEYQRQRRDVTIGEYNRLNIP